MRCSCSPPTEAPTPHPTGQHPPCSYINASTTHLLSTTITHSRTPRTMACFAHLHHPWTGDWTKTVYTVLVLQFMLSFLYVEIDQWRKSASSPFFLFSSWSGTTGRERSRCVDGWNWKQGMNPESQASKGKNGKGRQRPTSSVHMPLPPPPTTTIPSSSSSTTTTRV